MSRECDNCANEATHVLKHCAQHSPRIRMEDLEHEWVLRVAEKDAELAACEGECDRLRAEVASLRAYKAMTDQKWDEAVAALRRCGASQASPHMDRCIDRLAEERDAARAELAETLAAIKDDKDLFVEQANEIAAARAEAARYRAALEGFVKRAHEHKTPDCCKHDGYSLGFRDGINEAALVARAALAPHDKGTTDNGE